MASHLAILVVLLIIFLLALLTYRSQKGPRVRDIPAFRALPGQIGRAAESGQTLHLSMGTGGVGSTDTVASLAGISALSHLAEQGVASGTPPLITIADPTLLPLAQDVLRRAYARLGRAGDYRGTQVRLISPSSMAYALGTMDILNHEPVLANVMFGSFGPEVALITRAGADADLFQITGTDSPQASAILYSSSDRVVVGEELYSTSVYLDRTPPKLASLVAEDVARIVLILAMIFIALLRMVGAL